MRYLVHRRPHPHLSLIRREVPDRVSYDCRNQARLTARDGAVVRQLPNTRPSSNRERIKYNALRRPASKYCSSAASSIRRSSREAVGNDCYCYCVKTDDLGALAS